MLLQKPKAIAHFVAWYRIEEVRLATFDIGSASFIEAFAEGLAGYAVSGMLNLIPLLLHLIKILSAETTTFCQWFLKDLVLYIYIYEERDIYEGVVRAS